MKTVYEQKGFGWCQLILGILFIITALVAFRNPLGSMLALAMVFGFMAILSGVGLVTYRFGSRTTLLVGILEIVLGVLLLFNIGVTATILAYFFAFWFIINSVSNILLAQKLRFLGKGYYWFSLILNILCIVLGVVMLIEPALSMLTLSFLVGFYFMLAGIGCLLTAFAHPSIRVEIDGT